MKKLICLFLFLPAFAIGQANPPQAMASQESLKKSAETFVTNFMKYWEDKKYDQVMKSMTEDATFTTAVQTINWPDDIKASMASNAIPEFKFDIYSMSSEVFGQSGAIVTIRYIQSTTAQGNTRISDNLDLLVLVMKEGDWKLKSYNPQEFYPVKFSGNIDKKWQTGKSEPINRLMGSMNQMSGIFYYFMEESKKNGISPAQLGKKLGSKFATFWDPSKGFEGLVSGFLWNLQTMSNYIEVLERNGNTAKFKYDPLKQQAKRWNLTDQELLDYYRNAFGEISSYLGGTCSIAEDGNYYVLTLTSVPGWLPPAETQQLKEAVAKGDSAKVYNIRAQYLKKQGKFTEALKMFDKAAGFQPGNEEANIGRITMNFQAGKANDGLKIINQWVEGYPKNYQAWTYKAMAEADMGNTGESLKGFEKLTRLQPDSAAGWVGKGQMQYQLKKYPDALKSFNKAILLDPKRLDVHGMKAAAMARLGKFDEALVICNKVLELSPSNTETIYNRACVYNLKGDKANALADLKKAVGLNPLLKAYAQSDEDFKSIWNDADFKKLTQ